jgi:hypothetical protein
MSWISKERMEQIAKISQDDDDDEMPPIGGYTLAKGRQQYLDALNKADLTNTKQFHELFEKAIVMLNLSDQEIAKDIGMNEATISMWRQGTLMPHALLRSGILSWIKQKLYPSEPSKENGKLVNLNPDGTKTEIKYIEPPKTSKTLFEIMRDLFKII